jgi:hypothetical protein
VAIITENIDKISAKVLETKASDGGKDLVFLSGVAMVFQEGEVGKWIRDELQIEGINPKGPIWATDPKPEGVAIASLNSIYKDDQSSRSGWAVDRVKGIDVINGKIRLKLDIAIYHPGVKLLRVGYYITVIGKVEQHVKGNT